MTRASRCTGWIVVGLALGALACGEGAGAPADPATGEPSAEGPAGEGSAGEGSADEGSAGEGSAGEGSADEGSAGEGSADETSGDDGSAAADPAGGEQPTEEGAADLQASEEGEAGPLAAIAPGNAIRLRGLRVTNRSVDGRQLPTVALPDAEVRARLDALIEELAEGQRACEVPLALERFVSVRCTTVRQGSTASALQRGEAIRHVVIQDDGSLEQVTWSSLFLPGHSDQALTSLLFRRPEQRVHLAVWTQEGLELNAPGYASARPAVFGWRAIAPYLRPDSTIAAELREREVPLSSPDARLPPLPTPVPALWVGPVRGIPLLIHGWMGLPEDLRDRVTLVTSGELSAAGLLFPPGTDLEALRPAFRDNETSAGVGTGEGLLAGARSRIEAWVVNEATDVYVRPGTGGELAGHLPAGTLVPAVRGWLNQAVTSPERGFTYVGFSANHRGWVPADRLAAASTRSCVAPPRELDRRRLALRGRVEGATPYAWYVYRNRGMLGYRLAVVPMDGCALREAEAREHVLRAEPIAIYPTLVDGALVLAVRQRRDSRIHVYGPGSEDAVFTRPLGRNERLEVGDGGAFTFVDGEARVELVYRDGQVVPVE